MSAVANKTSIIDFENIYVNYGLTTVLENVNLKINSDENWVILGANGSGKSTLMKLFSQDMYPNTRYNFKKEIFGKEKWITSELKDVLGIITNDLQWQFLTMGQDVTAYEAVLSGFYSSIGIFKHQIYTSEQHKEVEKVMEFLALTDIKNKKVREMSTGQLRRCIVGRALIHSPKAFILDEPTTGLDIFAQRTFLKTLEDLSRQYPIILITHNIEEVFETITHVALMHNNTVYKQGLKQDILTSENLSEIFGMDLIVEENNGKYLLKY